MLLIKPYWGFEIRSDVCDFWREHPVKTRADTGRKHLAYPLWICQTSPCYDHKDVQRGIRAQLISCSAPAKSCVLCHRRRKLSHVMCWTSYTPRNSYPARRLRKVLSNVFFFKKCFLIEFYKDFQKRCFRYYINQLIILVIPMIEDTKKESYAHMLPLPLAGSAQCSFHPASAMWRCDTCGKGPEVQGRKKTQTKTQRSKENIGNQFETKRNLWDMYWHLWN